MNYLINNIVLFTTDTGVLRNICTGDEVVLPLPAARLLSLLISSKGEILTREFLFSEVWEKYGLVSGNSNLNNYLSLIRRTLQNMECGILIQTIPKVGIKLHNDVILEERNNEELSVDKKNENSHPKIYQTDKKIILIIILAFSLSIYLLLINYRQESFQMQSVHSYKGCNFVSIDKHPSLAETQLDNFAYNLLKQKGYSCEKNYIYFLSSVNKPDDGELTRYFISACKIDNVRLSNCNSFNVY